MMTVDTGVPGTACHLLVPHLQSMSTSHTVHKVLADPEINNIYLTIFVVLTYAEVLWLDVSVHHPLAVQVFHPADHLISYQQHCPYRELPMTEVEQTLYIGS